VRSATSTLSLVLLLGGLTLALSGCKEATLGPELTGTIEGRVLDLVTGQPLAGAGITTAPPSGALVTDADGSFVIEDLPAGNYTITASRNGYRTNTVTVSVREGRTTPAVLFLREDATAGSPSRGFEVRVENFENVARRTSSTSPLDSGFVRINYRAINRGDAVITAYEIYFRIETEQGRTFYQEQGGQNLNPGQQDARTFEKYIAGNRATAVVVDTFWLAP
jgi:hypothetical protein